MKKRISALLFALALLCSVLLTISSCSTACTNCEDKNRDHKCDACEEVLSQCADASKDHLCDTCKKTLSQCADVNADNACDTCQKSIPGSTVHVCADSDNDHVCDDTACKKELSTCADASKDHLCDTCKKTLSACADANKDHLCDTCKKTLSQCADANKDHLCDTCKKTLSACADASKDHLCDICQKTLSVCTDTIADNKCDICGKPIPGSTVHVCTDTDTNHECDDATCQKAVGTHEAAEGTHICDYCNQPVSDCVEGDWDKDGTCNVCGAMIESANNTPEILAVYNFETGEAVENGLMHVGANGKAYLKITFSAPADGSFILYNGECFYAEPEFSYYESYTYLYYVILPPQMSRDAYDTVTYCSLELCLAEQETPLATFECEQEKVRFLGIYLSEGDYAEGTANTGVTVAANQEATVYVACNTDFYPTYIALQEEEIPASGDYLPNADNIFFFEIRIPAEYLQCAEGEQMAKKLEFHIGEGIFCIYVINYEAAPLA